MLYILRPTSITEQLLQEKAVAEDKRRKEEQRRKELEIGKSSPETRI